MRADLAATEADLRRRYPLRDTTVMLPGHSLSLLAAAGAEELAAEAGGELPYWAEIWEAGQALAGYLLAGPPPPGPVLELGAGVGLVGIAAALRGARVVQTDRVIDALRAARVNAARSGVLHRVRWVAADWRAWPLAGRFSLVLGGEITYRSELHPPLLAALERAVAPGGTLLLADRARPAGDRFARRLLAAGWRVTDYPLPLPTRAAPGRLLRALAP
jgi:predicted nicotinamide N-methyase